MNLITDKTRPDKTRQGGFVKPHQSKILSWILDWFGLVQLLWVGLCKFSLQCMGISLLGLLLFVLALPGMVFFGCLELDMNLRNLELIPSWSSLKSGHPVNWPDRRVRFPGFLRDRFWPCEADAAARRSSRMVVFNNLKGARKGSSGGDTIFVRP